MRQPNLSISSSPSSPLDACPSDSSSSSELESDQPSLSPEQHEHAGAGAKGRLADFAPGGNRSFWLIRLGQRGSARGVGGRRRMKGITRAARRGCVGWKDAESVAGPRNTADECPVGWAELR